MIRLEHANLVVNDIPATLDFIQTAFPDWKIRGQGEMTWYGKPRRWLHVGDDDYYLTLNDDGEGENRDLSGHTPGLAHLGFVVDNVDGVIGRLEAKGYVRQAWLKNASKVALRPGWQSCSGGAALSPSTH